MKKFISLLMTVVMVLGVCTVAFAAPTVSITAPGTQKLQNAGNKVLGYVQWFGYAIAVGMLLYIGIKYMMASANEKADLKKGSISYVIGAVVVVAATSLFTILSEIATDVVPS